MRPSSAETLSASPRRPEPRSGSAPPMPSSATSTTACPLRRETLHGGLAGVRVLGHVGERLGDHEVGGGLDRLRQPVARQLGQVDLDRGAAGERLERGAESAIGQDRPGGCRGPARAARRAPASAPAGRRPAARRPCRGPCGPSSARAAASARARRAAAGRRRAGCAPAAGARRCRPRRSARARCAAPRRARAAAACRRSFSIARPAAAATEPSRSGSSQQRAVVHDGADAAALELDRGPGAGGVVLGRQLDLVAGGVDPLALVLEPEHELERAVAERVRQPASAARRCRAPRRGAAAARTRRRRAPRVLRTRPIRNTHGTEAKTTQAEPAEDVGEA